MKNELVHIDNFINDCGFFTSNTDENNGYGCTFNPNRKEEPGCCFTFDCPVAREADLEDLKELDKSLYEQYKDDANHVIGSGWMVVTKEEFNPLC